MKHTFTVIATDGITNATTEVVINILDVNDWEPRFREPHYEFIIPKLDTFEKPIALGKLEVADGDRNDRVNLHLRGVHSRLFTVDSRGVLWMKPEMLNTTIIHLMAIATDTGQPPKNSSVPVTIQLEETSQLKEGRWASGVLSAFSFVLALFIIVIILLSCYIYKT